MAVITLRIDEDTKDWLEAAAEDAGLTLSDLVRRGIDTIIGRSEADSEAGKERPAYPLSSVDRAILARLEDILGRLDEDEHERKRHQKAIDILENGYTADYGEVMFGLNQQLTETQCRLVWDTLDMYRIIRASLGRFDENARSNFSPYETEFPGFDLNSPEESPLLGYARHLIADDRWNDLADRFSSDNDYGNSHSPRLANYRAMIACWHQVQRDKRARTAGGSLDWYLLTPEEVEAILDAGRLGKNGR